MACDLCGKTGGMLTTLHECYQTDDIKEICNGCESKASKHLNKLKSISQSWYERIFKDWMSNIKHQEPQK